MLVCQVGKRFVELRKVDEGEVYYIVQSPNGQFNETDMDGAYSLFQEQVDSLFYSL